jgi:hypothetical protein
VITPYGALTEVVDDAVAAMQKIYPGVSPKTALVALTALCMAALSREETGLARETAIGEHFQRLVDAGPDLARPDWRTEIRLAALNRRPE